MIHTFAIDRDDGMLGQPDSGTPSGGYQVTLMVLTPTLTLILTPALALPYPYP